MSAAGDLLRTAVTAGALALAAGSSSGCRSAPPRVPLTAAWPAAQGEASIELADARYQATTKRWTRHGQVRNGYREVVTVDATLASPEWSAAKVERDAALAGDGPAERQARRAAAQAAEAAGYVVHLLIATWDRRENNLDRGERASWSVALLADDGRRLVPTKVVRDKRPRPVVRAEFDHLGDFAEAYTLTFPRDVELFGDAARRIRLRLSGAEGATELSWDAP